MPKPVRGIPVEAAAAPVDVADEVMQDVFDETPTAPEPEVSKPAAPVVQAGPKTVRVRTNVNHRCSIAGVWYQFVAGEAQNVPEDVKAILLRGGYLMPL